MGSVYKEPLHKQLERILKERIGSVYPLGSKIPTEIELAREFQVALQTVRRTLADLVREGLLVRRRGSGSFVRETLPVKPVALLCDWDLSTKENPTPELWLIRECQNALEKAGVEFRLYLGNTVSGKSKNKISSPAFLRGIEQGLFSVAILVSPVAEELRQQWQEQGIRTVEVPELPTRELNAADCAILAKEAVRTALDQGDL